MAKQYVVWYKLPISGWCPTYVGGKLGGKVLAYKTRAGAENKANKLREKFKIPTKIEKVSKVPKGREKDKFTVIT